MKEFNANHSIATLPSVFAERGDTSIIDLALELNVSEHLRNIAVADLQATFEKSPALENSWLAMSEDTRASHSWYVRQQPGSSQWEVGFYPGGEVILFNKRSEASATYALKFLGDLCAKIR